MKKFFLLLFFVFGLSSDVRSGAIFDPLLGKLRTDDAGTATYAVSSATATYAVSAGTSTTLASGSNVSTSGTITAGSYWGNGGNISGLTYSQLTGTPIWNQNTTGNANTATTASALASHASISTVALINVDATTGSQAGVIQQSSVPIIHNFGTNNFFSGTSAGNFAMTGAGNVGSGPFVLSNNTSGSYNFGGGYRALVLNQSGNYNVGIGPFALTTNVNGSSNTAGGYNSLGSTNVGNGTAFGYGALSSATGWNNSAYGSLALSSLTTGSGNFACGNNAGINQTTGNNNIYLGNPGVTGENNIARLGYGQTDTYVEGTLHADSGGITSSGTSSLGYANLTYGIAISNVISLSTLSSQLPTIVPPMSGFRSSNSAVWVNNGVVTRITTSSNVDAGIAATTSQMEQDTITLSTGNITRSSPAPWTEATYQPMRVGGGALGSGGTGTIILVYDRWNSADGSFHDTVYRMSYNGGATYSASPISLPANTFFAFSASPCGQIYQSTDDNSWNTIVRGTDGSGNYSVHLLNSVDQGTTWQWGMTVWAGSSPQYSHTSITDIGSGRAIGVMQKDNNSGVYVVLHSAGTTTFTSPVLTNLPSSNTAASVPYIAYESTRNVLILTYRDGNNIYYVAANATSVWNNPSVWPTPKIIYTGQGLSGYSPLLVIDSSYVWIGGYALTNGSYAPTYEFMSKLKTLPTMSAINAEIIATSITATVVTANNFYGASVTQAQGDNSANLATTAYVDTGLTTKSANPFTGTTTTIGGALLASVGTCTTATATITGATTTMIAVAQPSDGVHEPLISVYAYVSAPNTVSVDECALAAVIPATRRYYIRVLR